MKRLITLLLAVLYTFSSIGASVSTHYCMGKVRKCQCAKPKNNQKDHCCKDTVKFVKSQDVHAAKWSPVQTKESPLEQIISTDFEIPYVVSSNARTKYIFEYPLLWSPPPLYILYCNYRI